MACPAALTAKFCPWCSGCYKGKDVFDALEGTLRRFGALNVLIAVGDCCGKQAILAGFILLARWLRIRGNQGLHASQLSSGVFDGALTVTLRCKNTIWDHIICSKETFFNRNGGQRFRLLWAEFAYMLDVWVHFAQSVGCSKKITTFVSWMMIIGTPSIRRLNIDHRYWAQYSFFRVQSIEGINTLDPCASWPQRWRFGWYLPQNRSPNLTPRQLDNQAELREVFYEVS